MTSNLRLELAQVVDVKDPKALGRVRVEYADNVQSEWLSVITPNAGAGCGMFALPAEKTPALVAFATEDRTCGYILGFVWTGASKPPIEEIAKQQNVWIIQTGAKKTIRLDDSDAPLIEISDDKGNCVKLDTKENKISLISRGDLSIEAEGNITISGNGKVSINSKEIEFSQSTSS